MQLTLELYSAHVKCDVWTGPKICQVRKKTKTSVVSQKDKKIISILEFSTGCLRQVQDSYDSVLLIAIGLLFKSVLNYSKNSSTVYENEISRFPFESVDFSNIIKNAISK